MLAWMFMALLTLPFQLSEHGDIVVPVIVNGQGPFRFLLDTGSSRSAVTSGLAERLHLHAAGRTAVETPAGRTTRPLAALRQLQLGALPPLDLVATVVATGDLGGGAVEGIIGQDVLASRVYTIDYDRRMVVWHSAPHAEARGTRLQLSVNQGRMLVSLPQKGGRACLEFIPDSGSDGLVLFERSGRALPALTPLDVAAVRTLSGHQLVRRVIVDKFDVGEIRLEDHIGVLVPRGGAGTPDGDGLLPLHIFSRVTFNGPGGYLVIEQ